MASHIPRGRWECARDVFFQDSDLRLELKGGVFYDMFYVFIVMLHQTMRFSCTQVKVKNEWSKHWLTDVFIIRATQA